MKYISLALELATCGSTYFSHVIYIYIYIEKKNETFSHSFPFFAKERNILWVLLCSLQKNVAFSAFFYILNKRMQKNNAFRTQHKILALFYVFYKITQRSLHSFTFFIKVRGILCVLLHSL